MHFLTHEASISPYPRLHNQELLQCGALTTPDSAIAIEAATPFINQQTRNQTDTAAICNNKDCLRMPTYNCYTSLSCLTFKSVITPTKSEAASKSKGDDFILKLDEIKDNSDNEEQEQRGNIHL